MSAKLAVAVMAAVIGSGCIRSATLITVKPDGSGTIEQTVLMNAAALKGMLGGLGEPQQSASGGNEDELFVGNDAALSGGAVERVHVIDGRVPHSLIAELFTDKGVGTLVTR